MTEAIKTLVILLAVCAPLYFGVFYALSWLGILPREWGFPKNEVPTVAERSSTSTLSETENDIFYLYKTYREKIIHEDQLIHNRMMWLLLPESFLVMTIVICVPLIFVILHRYDGRIIEDQFVLDIITQYRIVGIGLALTGWGLAFFSLHAISQADRAIILLRQTWDKMQTWEKIWNEDRSFQDFAASLPPLTGGEELHRTGALAHNGSGPRIADIHIPSHIPSGDIIKRTRKKIRHNEIIKKHSFPVLFPLFFIFGWTIVLIVLFFPDTALWIGFHLPRASVNVTNMTNFG